MALLLVGFDRTYEELKLKTVRRGDDLAVSFDRTYEELKLNPSPSC